MSSLFGVKFVLFLFRLHTYIEVAALRSIILRYAGAPTAKGVSSFFPFVSLEMSLFSSAICTIAVISLCGEYVVHFSLADGVFYISLLCKNSIKSNMNHV